MLQMLNAPAVSCTLQIQVLGSLQVQQGPDVLDLPRSRKTRALLAYLAVSKRRHRRERLCEMFWDLPDDPRAALRWSLSKLRENVGDALQADRDSVGLRPGTFDLDIDTLPASSEFGALPVPELERVIELCRASFLEDLALPRAPLYEAWHRAHAAQIELLHLRARRALADRLLVDSPDRALAQVQALLAARPNDAALAQEVEMLTARCRQDVVAPSSRPQPGSVAPPAAAASAAQAAPRQQVRYCASRDGVQIAHGVTGQGYPIVKAGNFLSHLQLELENPLWRHWMTELSRDNQLIRYDPRGCGLSDRDVDDLSFESMVDDLEAVADAAAGPRFALLGVSQGCAHAVAYALRHPERVSHLILYGGYAAGWRRRGDAGVIARREAMTAMMRAGWGTDALTRSLAGLYIPGATSAQEGWFKSLQVESTSAETAARLHDAFGDIDVREALPRLTVPTLVLQACRDEVCPKEAGRALAAGIPGSLFVLLHSTNHILLADEPAFGQLIDEVRAFVAS